MGLTKCEITSVDQQVQYKTYVKVHLSGIYVCLSQSLQMALIPKLKGGQSPRVHSLQIY